MKVVKKNIYYCDFCKKKGMAAGHMRTHELHCTGNPNRHCRLCEDNVQTGEVAEKLKLRYKINEVVNDEGVIQNVEWIGKPVTLDEIRRITDNCPACILAILRQSKLNWRCFGFEFEYKKESEQYLKDKMKENTTWY